MSVITEFTIPADAFALQRTFEAVPDVTIEIERLATHSREWIMPFLWATSDDLDSVERALRSDPSIDELEAIGADGSIGQFKVQWVEDFQTLIDQIVNQHAIIQEAEAAHGVWSLKLKFVDQDAVSEFQTYFHEREYQFELQRLYEATAPKEREYELSHEQYEVLVTALELGYFSIPRDAQIGDLANELGISTDAVSQRLRRAMTNLTSNTLTISTPESANDMD
ncbi:helix-turn-helix domain-containing protein [Halorientalis salina]|uniref:helix-turn-helix domain-containing protein n=1 Tax=Halorientalis salina TaxID=2932266 RepID=UPI0010ABD747|nr:helix-turn-helix domain-containing protein [Halorientalis salina]